MSKIGLFLLVLFSIFLYGTFLSRVPVHLNQDELGFSLNAYSIAKTGFDENGRFMPLYFWHLGVIWATPVIVYLTALVLKILPLSEMAIRLPSAIVGVTNIVLIWFLAKRIFKSSKWAFICGLLLALTPVQFIQSRILLDNLYPIPFILAWLLCLDHFFEKNNLRVLLLGVFLLGIGVHSYHATKIMMPVYFLTTLVLIWPQIKKNSLLWGYLFIAFFLPLIPLLWWLKQYPDTLIDQVKYTGIYDIKLSPILGFLTLLSPQSLIHRADVFINFFNPAFLFFKGDDSLIHSTQRAGVFLLPLIAFLPAGIASAWAIKGKFSKLLIFGFFTSPIAATVAGDHFRISRALFMIPFAILLATFGVKMLLSKYPKITLVLLLLIPLQFGAFWYNYMKGYRFRSYQWFNYNIGGALESAINKSAGKEKIYLDKRVDFIDRYWTFNTIKYNRTDLQTKIELFDPYHMEEQKFPKNSLFVVQFNNVDGQKDQIGEFKKVDTIYEPDSTSRFFLFEN